MDDLSTISKSNDLAVLRKHFEEAVKGSLDIADERGVCVKARLDGADEQGDEGPELEALLEETFHSMFAQWTMRDDSMRHRRQVEQFCTSETTQISGALLMNVDGIRAR